MTQASRSSMAGALAIGAALLLVHGSAKAQATTGGALPPQYVYVHLEASEPEHRFTLALDDVSPPFARCRGACALWLHAGEPYQLTIGATERTVEGSRLLRVREPSRVRITPRESAGANPLEIAGWTLFAIGVPITVLLVAASQEDDQRDSGSGAMAGLGLMAVGLAVVGVALATTGASQPPRTRPSLDVEPLGR